MIDWRALADRIAAGDSAAENDLAVSLWASWRAYYGRRLRGRCIRGIDAEDLTQQAIMGTIECFRSSRCWINHKSVAIAVMRNQWLNLWSSNGYRLKHTCTLEDYRDLRDTVTPETLAIHAEELADNHDRLINCLVQSSGSRHRGIVRGIWVILSEESRTKPLTQLERLSKWRAICKMRQMAQKSPLHLSGGTAGR